MISTVAALIISVLDYVYIEPKVSMQIFTEL